MVDTGDKLERIRFIREQEAPATAGAPLVMDLFRSGSRVVESVGFYGEKESTEDAGRSCKGEVEFACRVNWEINLFLDSCYICAFRVVIKRRVRALIMDGSIVGIIVYV